MKKRSKRQKEAFASARALLDGMIENSVEVQMMFSIRGILATFRGKIEKGLVEETYRFAGPGWGIDFAPKIADWILFSHEGGLAMQWKLLGVCIEPSEVNAEELLARYPPISKWIH